MKYIFFIKNGNFSCFEVKIVCFWQSAISSLNQLCNKSEKLTIYLGNVSTFNKFLGSALIAMPAILSDESVDSAEW